MNATISVALITSLSTLAGASITGYIGFLISRTHSRAQRALADEDRIDQRSKERRQIRRDAYVQFLNQASAAEQSLDSCWRSMPPSDLTKLPSIIEPITTELDNLQRLINLITLEGPNEVTSATHVLLTKMLLESVKLAETVSVAKKNQSILLHDEQLFNDIKIDRATVKSKVIRTMQDAIHESGIPSDS